MKLHARVRRLEQKLGGTGCPACRHRRWQVVLVDGRELPDGTVVSEDDGCCAK